MEKEKELQYIIDNLMAEYHSTIDELTRFQERALHDKIKEAKQKLSAHLAEGAIDCACGGKPSGMLKRPAIMKGGLMDKAPIYSIYCNKCTGTAYGNTPKMAVANWNTYNATEK